MSITTDSTGPQTLGSQPPRRSRALWWLLAVVAVVAAAVVVIAVLSDDDGSDQGSTTTTSITPTTQPTTTRPPTTSPAQLDDVTVLWPFPGTATRFATPDAAARSFAIDFLRFEAPVLGAFQQGDARSGEVPLRPRDRGPVTTILVRQVGPGEDWSVLGAVTDNIEVTTPAAGATITSPVTVTGRALAFEGTVQVEIRADGNLGPLGSGFVTGGGDVPRPFQGVVPFETPGAPYGALVFFTESAEDGQVWEAAALRVAFDSTDIDAAACGGYRSPRQRPAPGQMEVKAYLSCDAEDGALRPVYRLVPESAGVLRASLEALLAGPSAEERAASLGSWFSAETAGMLRSVTVDDGHAVVDFDDLRPVIPNASSSAGSERLLAQLDATVFQFRSVESVEYRIQGSCEAFNEWLQYGGCTPRTRPAATD